MREFTTSAEKAKSAIEGAEPIEFKLDGSLYTAYPPTSGQFMLVMAAMGGAKFKAEDIATYVDFLASLLDVDSMEAIRVRLMDRNDPLDFETISEIVNGLVEEWSEHPTGSASASSTSPRPNGRRSTAKPRSKASIS